MPVISPQDPLPTGRRVTPAGRVTPLGVYSTGVAVSPDGSTALVTAGRPINGGVNAGPTGGPVLLMVVDTATGFVRQTLQAPDAFQSAVYAPDGSRAWVAGGTTAAVHPLTVLPGGLYKLESDIPLDGYVAGLALSPDGKRLWASEPEAPSPGNPHQQTLVEIDTSAASVVRKVPAATPDALAMSPDGATVYATAWRGAAVTAVDTATGTTREIAVGEHPTAIATLPDGRVLVANSNDASLSTITPGTWSEQRTSLALLDNGTDSPNGIALASDGRVLVSLGGDNAVAVLRPGHGNQPWRLAGLIPTGWYPDAIAVGPDGSTLQTVTARGYGRSAPGTALPTGTDPGTAAPFGAYFAVGTLESLSLAGADLMTLTRQARQDLEPERAPQRQRGNPVLLGPKGPIKHIIYVLRENKTYDSDLGDLHPGPGAAFTLFGAAVTPNLHKLETQFTEPDNFYHEGYASNVGHMWTDTGGVSDVFERAIASGQSFNAAHIHTDWSEPTNYLRTGLFTAQVARSGQSVRTYNEELAQESGLLPAAYQADPAVFPNYDLHIPEVRREAGWESEFRQFESHQCTGALATTYGTACELPALEYVFFGMDHTSFTNVPGFPILQAQVANNDLATGKLIEAVSHSPDWASTLVIVLEDDPQSAGDSVSPWRNLMAIASPWVKRGYISHVRYNQSSVIAAIDRILGLPPLTDYVQTARPLEDLFITDGHPDMTPYTADPSGVDRFPFVPLPGKPPAADPAHGVYSFAHPDDIDQELAARSQLEQLKASPHG